MIEFNNVTMQLYIQWHLIELSCDVNTYLPEFSSLSYFRYLKLSSYVITYAVYVIQCDVLSAWNCMKSYRFIYFEKGNVATNVIDCTE